MSFAAAAWLSVLAAFPCEASAAGCCFAFGFGALMKPCCLKVWHVGDANDCPSQARLGGATSYVDGSCPSSAEEAANLWQHQQEIHRLQQQQPEQPEQLKTPHPQEEGWGLLSEPAVDLVPSSLSAVHPNAGCCFSIGYGAFEKPCCLQTRSVNDVAECSTMSRNGGADMFTMGACPTLEEAAAIIEATWIAKAKGFASRDSVWKSAASVALPVLLFAGGVAAVLGWVHRPRHQVRQPLLSSEYVAVEDN